MVTAVYKRVKRLQIQSFKKRMSGHGIVIFQRKITIEKKFGHIMYPNL
jgi:hypothetical protein